MHYVKLATIAALGLVWVGVSAATPTRDAPTVTAPITASGTAPAAALTDHAKRVGKVSFNATPLQAPDAATSKARAGVTDPWLAPQLHFDLFPNVSFDAVGVRLEQDDFGNSSWVGKIKGAGNGTVIITTHGSTVVGRVDIGLSQYLLNGDANTGVWVTELDPFTYRNSDQHAATTAYLSKLNAPTHVTLGGMFTPNTVTAGHTIDVLILYTQHASSRMQVGLDVSPFVANMVADANQSFFNSGVDGAVRVVGYKYVSGYVEPIVSGWPDAYDEFTDVRDAMYNGTGYFANVSSLRDQYHADVAILFVDGTRITDGPCGISYPMETNKPNSARVYEVLSTECAIGDRTFTHELGHIMSGRHDISTGQDTYNPYDDDFGYTSINPAFHTIMGDENNVGNLCNNIDGCPRINYWSSLSQTYMNAPLGQTVGTLSTDMANVLGDTVPLVAAYQTPVGLQVPGAPGSVLSYDCANSTTIRWGAASGTVGWYDADWSTSSAMTSPFAAYRGYHFTFKTHVWSGKWLGVKACNAAGCSGYATAFIPATGPGCSIPPI